MKAYFPRVKAEKYEMNANWVLGFRF